MARPRCSSSWGWFLRRYSPSNEHGRHWCGLLSAPPLASCFLRWPGCAWLVAVWVQHIPPSSPPRCSLGSSRAAAAAAPELLTFSTLRRGLARATVSWPRHLAEASFWVCTPLFFHFWSSAGRTLALLRLPNATALEDPQHPCGAQRVLPAGRRFPGRESGWAFRTETNPSLTRAQRDCVPFPPPWPGSGLV